MVRGIENMNHCCFVNSSLQLLLNCKNYINELKKHSSDIKLYTEFIKFINNYTFVKYLFSNDIQECLGFQYGHPSDCFDFLQSFMQVMSYSIPLYKIEFSENINQILEQSSEIEIIICVQRVKNNKKIIKEYNLPFQCEGYQLKSFIVHEGNVNFGHYIAIIITEADTWYCNDRNVFTISRDECEKYAKNFYIGCYSKF
jgi:ubiquitin C-terminal hydrolase